MSKKVIALAVISSTAASILFGYDFGGVTHKINHDLHLNTWYVVNEVDPTAIPVLHPSAKAAIAEITGVKDDAAAEKFEAIFVDPTTGLRTQVVVTSVKAEDASARIKLPAVAEGEKPRGAKVSLKNLLVINEANNSLLEQIDQAKSTVVGFDEQVKNLQVTLQQVQENIAAIEADKQKTLEAITSLTSSLVTVSAGEPETVA